MPAHIKVSVALLREDRYRHGQIYHMRIGQRASRKMSQLEILQKLSPGYLRDKTTGTTSANKGTRYQKLMINVSGSPLLWTWLKAALWKVL